MHAGTRHGFVAAKNSCVRSSTARLFPYVYDRTFFMQVSIDHVEAIRKSLLVCRDSMEPVPFAAIDDRMYPPSPKPPKTIRRLSGVHIGL